MVNNSKGKLMFITLLLMLLLISSAYAIIVPAVNAVEPNLQEKSISVLSDVVGLNTEKYTTSQSKQRDNQFLGYPQTETDTHIVSTEGRLRVTCSYVKDTLKLVYLSDVEGELSLRQPVSNTVEMAKGLLERYQTYSGDSVYGKFASMLNGIESNVDETKYAENVKLEISGSDSNSVSYTWTYVDSNGVLAEKKNVILTYEKGAFKGFFNNWPLYTIAETESKFSAEQSTELAIEASKNFSYPVTCDNGTEIMVSGFSIAPESLGDAKLIYVNSVEQELARGNDPFRLYLAWYIPLGFDRFYSGDVSGMTVIMWADTGEVCGMDRVIVDSEFGASLANQLIEDEEAVVQSSQLQSTAFSTQAIWILAVVGLVSVSIGATQKIIVTGRRKRGRKLLGTLLCALMAFSVIFVSLPSVSAASVTGRSRIYSSVGTKFGYKNGTADTHEENATAELCNFVGNASLDAGYITTNSYSNTINTTVISNAGSDEQNYLNTMVFHSGHLSNPNKAYQASDGGAIVASEIYEQTSLGRHFFVFLWVCVQAEDHTEADGTPVGWTHRDGSQGHPYMNSNGYGAPDGNGQCYISFYGFSPMLSTYVNQSGGYYYNFADVGSPGPCSYFAMKFYYYALYEDYSVHDALDLASGDFFGCNYASTVLFTGYHSWWPGGNWGGKSINGTFYENPLCDPGYYPRDFNDAFSQFPWNEEPRDPNKMQVFGDSNIKLCQSDLTLSGVDDSSNPLSPEFTIDDQTQYSSSCTLVSKSYEVDVNDLPNYEFSHFSYDGVNYYDRPADILLDEDETVTAHYTWDPVNYDLTISKTGTGTTNPASGTSYPYLSYTYAQVTATPGANMMHYWSGAVSEGSIWKPTISVLMSSDRSVQANFVAATAYNFVSYVESSDGAVIDDYKICGPYPNDQYAVTSANENYDVYGEITAHLYFTTLGHIYVYAKAVATGGPLDVYTSADGSNWNYIGAASVSSTNPSWIDCG